MKTVFFQIAKKMNKAVGDSSGVQLTWLRGTGDSAAMVITAPSLEPVRESLDEQKRKGEPLSYRTRGKSLEISAVYKENAGALSVLFAFADTLDFGSSDVCDLTSFGASQRDYEEGTLTMVSAEADKGSALIDVRADIADDAQPEAFYARLMAELEPLGMGIIKPRAEE